MTTTTRFGMLVAMVVLAACGQEAPPTLQGLELSQQAITVTENLQASVAATAVYSDGSRQDVTAQAAWTTQDGSVASANAGLVQAAAPGSTTVLAAWQGLEASARVDVVAAEIVTLQVDTQATLPAGLRVRPAAYGTFSDGSTRDVTASATWSISGQAVALDAGELRAVAPGSAELQAAVGALTSSVALVVTEAIPLTLSVTGLEAALAKGDTAAFAATVTYSDDRQVDVNPTVAVSFSSGGVVEQAGAALHALAAGSVLVRFEALGVSQELTVQVTPAVLRSIELVITKNGAVVAEVRRGDAFQVTATGLMSDGTTALLTEAVAWGTSDPSVATVSNMVAPGFGLALARGTATLSATYGSPAITGTAALSVR